MVCSIWRSSPPPGICLEDLRKIVETFTKTDPREGNLNPRLLEYDVRTLDISLVTSVLLACYLTTLSVAEIM